MASPDKTSDHPNPPRLALVTPLIVEAADFAPLLSQAIANGDVAAVLLRLGESDERTLTNAIKGLAPAVQAQGAALVLVDRPELAARSGADGAHLTGYEAFDTALPKLKPERIAGAGALATRDDAMTAAEAGADYIMFGGPDADGRRPPLSEVEERVAWWAEVFTVPCMAYAATLDEVSPLYAAGAEFIALAPEIWIASPAESVAAAMSRFVLPEIPA